MPIAGLVCRTCLTVTPPEASHWLIGGCQDPTMDPGLLQAALIRQREREEMTEKFRAAHENGEPWFEVSEILGGVRDVFLRRHFALYPEAQYFNSMEVGSAVGLICEIGLRALGWETQSLVYGKLLGVNVFGYIDARTPDWTTIRDTKFKSQGAFFFQQGRGHLADELTAAQINCYRLLAMQMGAPADRAFLEVRYGSNPPAVDSRSKEKLDPWMWARAQYMDEEEIGRLFPGGSETSVAQNVGILVEAERRIADGESVENVAERVPMSCKSMFGKMKCGFYCGALYTCYGLAKEEVRKIGKPRVSLPGGR